jgi:hypothetical protein
MAYETTSLNEATFLRVEGFRLLRTEWRDNRLWFIFEPGANQAARRYFQSREGQRCHDILRMYRILRSLALDVKEAHT